MDNVRYSPEDVEEQEFSIMSASMLSGYLGALYFPTQRLVTFEKYAMFDGITEKERSRWGELVRSTVDTSLLLAGKKRLILKNPVDMGHLKEYTKLYPQAKFIHIHRHPYEVLRSTKKLWKVYVPSTAFECYDTKNDLPYIMHAYKRLMSEYLADKDTLGDDQLVEISYDDFCKNPLDKLEQIYRKLGLEGFDAAKPFFQEYLGGVSNYQCNTYAADPELDALAWEECQDIFQHFGYSNRHCQAGQ